MFVLEQFVEPDALKRAVLKAGDGLDITFAYASGSLVDGFGNPLSDLDVYVIYHDDAASAKETREICLSVCEKPVELTFVPRTYMESIFQRVTAEHISAPEYFSASKFVRQYELLLAHRLRVGIPIVGQGDFDSFRKKLPDDAFCRYVSSFCGILAQDAYRDVRGAVEGRDLDTAALVAREMIDSDLDAYLALSGEPLPIGKWRLRKAVRALGFDDITVTKYRELSSAIDLLNKVQTEKWIGDCLAYHQLLAEKCATRALHSGFADILASTPRQGLDRSEWMPSKRGYTHVRHCFGRFYITDRLAKFEISVPEIALWLALNGRRDVSQIQSMLSAETCPFNITADRVRSLLDLWRDRGLIQ